MSTDDLDQITRLFRLRESGALTQAEFETEKARVLSVGDEHRAASEEARPLDPVGAAVHSEAPQQDESPHEEAYRRFNWPLTLIVLATILMIGAGVGWYAMRGSPTTAGDAITGNAGDPTTIPPPTQIAGTQSAATTQNAASLYQWATSIEPLGLNPDYLIQKLGVPRRHDGSTLDFIVAGCNIHYEVDGTAISYFDAEVSASCKPSLLGLNAASRMNLAHATSLAQVEQRAGGLIIADCLEMCGNAADPAQYLFIEGPRADNFINVAVMADPKSSNGTQKWASFVRAAHSLSHEDDLPAQGYQCGTEGQDVALQEVGPAPIHRVLVGQDITKEMLTLCGVNY